MSIAVLFPGQGSQSPGMLPWLEEDRHAAPVLYAMQAIVGRDWRQRSGDRDWLSQNRIAQCLLTGLNLAAWRALLGAGLEEAGPVAAIAGYSVGELSSFCAAGVFDFNEALRLSMMRAQRMNESTLTPGCLISTNGCTAEEIRPALKRWQFDVAIVIAADRLVLGGPCIGLDGLDNAIREQGATTTRLNVAVASHTPAMAQASAEFFQEVLLLEWKTPRIPLIANDTGARVISPTALKASLARQISHTVQWETCMRSVSERLPQCAIEVGPGTALSRMWMQTNPKVPVRSVDEFENAAGAVKWIAKSSRT